MSSTSPPPKQPAPRRPSTSRLSPAAGRYLFLFLLGLVLGAVAVVMILRAIDARKTWQDRYPYAAMQLMQAHMAQLAASSAANRCAATDTLPHLQALRTIANDIEPAFPDLRDDARFVSHAGELRATLDRALAAPPMQCAGVGNILKQVSEACKACHQDYRG
ncbi:hypothetical protein BH23PSE2_BH23PSE2_07790 [soil metagenome]